jgi:hypothetical protein
MIKNSGRECEVLAEKYLFSWQLPSGGVVGLRHDICDNFPSQFPAQFPECTRVLVAENDDIIRVERDDKFGMVTPNTNLSSWLF